MTMNLNDTYCLLRGQHRIIITIHILFTFGQIIAPIILIRQNSNFHLFGTAPTKTRVGISTVPGYKPDQ